MPLCAFEFIAVTPGLVEGTVDGSSSSNPAIGEAILRMARNLSGGYFQREQRRSLKRSMCSLYPETFPVQALLRGKVEPGLGVLTECRLQERADSCMQVNVLQPMELTPKRVRMRSP